MSKKVRDALFAEDNLDGVTKADRETESFQMLSDTMFTNTQTPASYGQIVLEKADALRLLNGLRARN
jgi:hypothetical protein